MASSRPPRGGDIRNSFSARERKQELVHTNDRLKRQCRADDNHRPNVIDLEDDEVDVRQLNSENYNLIEIDENEIEAKLEEELRQQRAARPRRAQIQVRNPPIVLPWAIIKQYVWNGFVLRDGKTVELMDGSIFQIKSVIQNSRTDEVRFRGLRLMRARQLNGMLSNKLNEMCARYEVDQYDKRSALEQSLVEFNLDSVLKIRRLTCTNRPFLRFDPNIRFDPEYVPGVFNNDGTFDKQGWKKLVEETEVLVLRWKFTSTYESAFERSHPLPLNFIQHKFETLPNGECTPNCGLPADARRRMWRGETKLGGSGSTEGPRVPLVEDNNANRPGNPFIHLSDGAKDSEGTPAGRSTRAAVQCYTFGDCCKSTDL
jgi:hypothetical protein